MSADAASAPIRPADPCSFVIFGASGDLTRRLLIPALYNLGAGGLLPDVFCVIGIARKDFSDEAFRSYLEKGLRDFATRQVDERIAQRLFSCVTYLQGDIDDPKTYERLRHQLARVEQARPTRGNRLFYIATPPAAFAPIGCQLGRTGLTREENGAWRRVIIEKPFGTDLASARALNHKLLDVLDEHQIYRIDHYLGKETVQNILVLRFANGLFEPIWNRDHIDHVQITVAESQTVGQRGRFYDTTGALRDMVPNHLFQLLSLVAMEPPARFDGSAVRAEKAELLDATQVQSTTDALHNSVRAQYQAGYMANNRVDDYRKTADVDPASVTETYVALKLMIDNWRWAGVPFYLRTGKRLAARHTEVAVQFKRAPLVLFRDTPVNSLDANQLIIHIAPDEGISLRFGAKIPGAQMKVGEVEMDFNYRDYFGTTANTGYEVLLYDGIMGDQTLYQRADMVEAGWTVVDPILDVWKALAARNFPNYAAGSWGPEEATDIIARDGRSWRKIKA